MPKGSGDQHSGEPVKVLEGGPRLVPVVKTVCVAFQPERHLPAQEPQDQEPSISTHLFGLVSFCEKGEGEVLLQLLQHYLRPV